MATLLVAACAPGGVQATTTSSSIPASTTLATTTTLPPTTTTSLASTTTTLDHGDLTAWEVTKVFVADEELAVAVADEPGERAQGLMGISDLGDLAGMLFVYDADTQTSFWMKDTIIPLDIAFFAGDGSFVDLLTMEPCATDPCPFYHAAGPFRWALEVPAGDLESLATGVTLVVP